MKWDQQVWKIANFQIYEMNGIQFLFEFHLRETTEHIVLGKWTKQGKNLQLDWWSPLAGVYPANQKFDRSWIRVLGLPLHLWSNNTMKKLGDKCGGWIETEEETSLKNHLRWARLKVRGSIDKIPREVEISDGEFIFNLSVWVETPARFKEKDEQHGNPSDSRRFKNGGFCFFDSQKVIETHHTLEQKREGKSPMDLDMLAGNVAGPSQVTPNKTLPPYLFCRSGPCSNRSYFGPQKAQLSKTETFKPISAEPFTEFVNTNLNSQPPLSYAD